MLTIEARLPRTPPPADYFHLRAAAPTRAEQKRGTATALMITCFSGATALDMPPRDADTGMRREYAAYADEHRASARTSAHILKRRLLFRH